MKYICSIDVAGGVQRVLPVTCTTVLNLSQQTVQNTTDKGGTRL